MVEDQGRVGFGLGGGRGLVDVGKSLGVEGGEVGWVERKVR